ncbi:rhotekin-like protein [Columba livia]|nr:rhotekin-like protein [Columba livia]
MNTRGHLGGVPAPPVPFAQGPGESRCRRSWGRAGGGPCKRSRRRSGRGAGRGRAAAAFLCAERRSGSGGSRAGGGQRAPLLTALDAAGSAEGDAGWMRDTPSTPPSPPGVSGGAPVVPMEVAGRGQRLQMQEKLRILEDLNMLYIRQIAISLQDTEMQRKLERELRLRDGACKLLAACSRREQALGAAQSLLLCSARALAYMAELQRRKEAQLLRRAARRPSDTAPGDERLPCRGTVCLSDLRIPLMWKDTEYFRNKGELHRCAVFCLLQLGAEIHDTPMVLVDRTLTDICFEGAFLFAEAGPDFELKVELYSAALAGGAGAGQRPQEAGHAPQHLAGPLLGPPRARGHGRGARQPPGERRHRAAAAARAQRAGPPVPPAGARRVVPG